MVELVLLAVKKSHAIEAVRDSTGVVSALEGAEGMSELNDYLHILESKLLRAFYNSDTVESVGDFVEELLDLDTRAVEITRRDLEDGEVLLLQEDLHFGDHGLDRVSDTVKEASD